MMASQAGKVEVVRLLLDKGVSYNVVDSDGRSLTELTIAWGNPDVLAVLQEYGANYNDVTSASG
jgi:ankyrin repeat protein